MSCRSSRRIARDARIALVVVASALGVGASAESAWACGVAYPAGSYARLATERTLVVWDAANGVEHFVRKPTFDGDATSFAFFVPTPVVPEVKQVDDDVVTRVAALVERPLARGGGDAPGGAAGQNAHVEVIQQTQIGAFEVVTLRATNGDVLGEWLAQHGYVETRNLRYWAQRYVEKGWVINAMKYAPDGTSRRELVTPTVRFSFKIAAPFYPYTEPVADVKDEVDFVMKYRAKPSAANPLADLTPVSIPKRPVDVWVVSTEPVHTTGNFLEGLPAQAAAHVTGEQLATALGDTSSWGFDATARRDWVVTYLHEELEQRVAFEDLTFEAIPPAVSTTTPASGSWLRGREILVFVLIALVAALVAVVGSERKG